MVKSNCVFDLLFLAHVHMHCAGNYNTNGHCNQSSYNANMGCAGEGEAFLDICGNTRGAIQQTLYTDPLAVYTISFLYESHAGCSASAVTQMYVALVGGANNLILNDSVTHVNVGTWSLNWTTYSHTFTATSDRVTLSFTSVTVSTKNIPLRSVVTVNDF